MIVRITVFTLCLLFASACTEDQQGATEALRKEVIDIHDEIMPRMREIEELKEELQTLANSLANENSEEVSDKIAQIQAASESLTQAKGAMNTWMQSFKYEISDDIDHEQIMNYLGNEKEKITQVKDIISQSLDSSRLLIEQLKNS
ncbi:MAG: hypothetical protein AAF694_03285 [Bacteroidota bacterium]